METIIATFPTAAALACSALVDTIAKLEEERGALRPASAPPNRLQLADVEVENDAFNVRGGELDEYHLHKLGRALVVIGDLTPILVLPCRDRFVLVDGHHRLAAYGIAGRADIPVKVFHGSVREAVLEASQRGTVATLQMDNRQRQDCAWRLVNADFTIRQIERSSGISRAQVGVMRSARKALGDDAAQFNDWYRAKRAANGRVAAPLSDDEIEAMIEAQVLIHADRMKNTFGNKLATNPEIAARVMARYLGRKLPDFAFSLKPYLSEGDFAYLASEGSDF